MQDGRIDHRAILAFALDPDAAGRATRSRPNAPPPDPKPAPPPEVASPIPPSRTEPARWQPQIALQLAALSGILPKPTLALRAIVGVRRTKHSEWEIFGQVSDERDKLIDRTTVGGSFRLLSVGARVFWEPLRAGWTMRLSVGCDIEEITASGLGVSQPGNGSATMPAALVGAQLGWPVTRSVAFHIEGDVAARADSALASCCLPPAACSKCPRWTLFGATGIELSF